VNGLCCIRDENELTSDALMQQNSARTILTLTGSFISRL
jgi:hypothetical protein